MVLYPRRILALSLGCSVSSGSRSLGIFSCFEISPLPTLVLTPERPVALLSSSVVAEIPACRTLGRVLLGRRSGWIRLGWVWVSVITEDWDFLAGLTLPPASFLFTLMKCDYFPEVSDLGASDVSHALILRPPEAAYFNFTSAAVACPAREGGQALAGSTSAPGQGGILAQPGPGSFRRDDSALRRAAAAVGLEQEKIGHPQDREVSKAKRHRRPRAQGRANVNPPRTAAASGSATVCKSTAWATLQPCRFNGSGVLPSPLEKRRKKRRKAHGQTPLSAYSERGPLALLRTRAGEAAARMR